VIVSAKNAGNPWGLDMIKISYFENAHPLIIGISNYKDPKIIKNAISGSSYKKIISPLNSIILIIMRYAQSICAKYSEGKGVVL
jgi:hypothetical protein